MLMLRAARRPMSDGANERRTSSRYVPASVLNKDGSPTDKTRLAGMSSNVPGHADCAADPRHTEDVRQYETT